MAASLAACGTSGDSTTATTSTPSESGQSGSANSSEAGGGGDGSAGSGGGSDDSGAADEGSTAFREQGGDNSIQDYGAEADESERGAAEKTLTAFMAARAKQDWATACEFLGEEAVKPLEKLGKRSPQLKGKDCAELLMSFTGKAPAAAFVNTLKGPVASLRVDGDRGFALYHGPQQVDYFMVMIKEGDEWKVASISPSEFPGSG